MRVDDHDDSVDDALRRLDAWEPPAGFVERVSALGARAVRMESRPTWRSTDLLRTASAGAIAGSVAWVVALLAREATASLLASGATPEIVWIWVAAVYALWVSFRPEELLSARPPASAGPVRRGWL